MLKVAEPGGSVGTKPLTEGKIDCLLDYSLNVGNKTIPKLAVGN